MNEVEIGDVVYGSRLSYSDVDATGFDYIFGQVPQMPSEYSLNQDWLTLFDSLDSSKDYSIHKGLIVTSDSFMSQLDLVKRVKGFFQML